MTAVPDSTPEALVPRGCTNFRLRQLMRRLDQHYDAELAKAGLKTTQYSLLSHIVKLEPVGPGALALAMKMQPSTLTRNLQPLVQAGWVRLDPGADARSRIVTSTQAGRDKRTEAQRRWKTAQTVLNQTLQPARVAALHVLLDQCMDMLSEAAKAAPEGSPRA
jgi:DNA-binding MarR family transcriptional regulator